MSDTTEQLSRASERLLDAVDDLRATEAKKRDQKISSDEFHRLAEEVTQKSRRLMATASDEEEIGNDTDPVDDSIESASRQREERNG